MIGGAIGTITDERAWQELPGAMRQNNIDIYVIG